MGDDLQANAVGRVGHCEVQISDVGRDPWPVLPCTCGQRHSPERKRLPNTPSIAHARPHQQERVANAPWRDNLPKWPDVLVVLSVTLFMSQTALARLVAMLRAPPVDPLSKSDTDKNVSGVVLLRENLCQCWPFCANVDIRFGRSAEGQQQPCALDIPHERNRPKQTLMLSHILPGSTRTRCNRWSAKDFDALVNAGQLSAITSGRLCP